jgi:hypothetical protein
VPSYCGGTHSDAHFDGGDAGNAIGSDVAAALFVFLLDGVKVYVCWLESRIC